MGKGEGVLHSLTRLPCLPSPVVPSGAAEMDSEDIKELQQEVMEELGISMEELQEIIEKEVENSEWVRQRKQQLEELEQCMKHKEEEVAHVDQLIDDAMRCVVRARIASRAMWGPVPVPFRADPRRAWLIGTLATFPPGLYTLPAGASLSWASSGCPCGIREAQPLSLLQGHRQVRDAGQGAVLHDGAAVPGEQL